MYACIKSCPAKHSWKILASKPKGLCMYKYSTNTHGLYAQVYTFKFMPQPLFCQYFLVSFQSAHPHIAFLNQENTAMGVFNGASIPDHS